MAGKLTTHVLDTAAGKPAVGMKVELIRTTAGRQALIKSTRTNADGRPTEPLLANGALKRGEYTLLFHVGDYFAKQKRKDARRFLNRVPIVFSIDDPSKHFHVPLLVSPWSYSTYRGS